MTLTRKNSAGFVSALVGVTLLACGADDFQRSLSRHAECRAACDVTCLGRSYSPELWAAAEMEKACQEANQSGIEAVSATMQNTYRRGDSGFATMVISSRLKETGKVYELRLTQEWVHKDGVWRLTKENPADAPQR